MSGLFTAADCISLVRQNTPDELLKGQAGAGFNLPEDSVYADGQARALFTSLCEGEACIEMPALVRGLSRWQAENHDELLVTPCEPRVQVRDPPLLTWPRSYFEQIAQPRAMCTCHPCPGLGMGLSIAQKFWRAVLKLYPHLQPRRGSLKTTVPTAEMKVPAKVKLHLHSRINEPHP